MTVDTRVNNVSEKVSELTEVGLLLLQTATPGDTTLDASAASGQKIVPVTAETNFSVDDDVVIDEGNLLEVGVVGATAAGQLTLKSNLHFTHASGVVCKELLRVNLGEVTEDGIVDEFTSSPNVIHTGTRYGPWDLSKGHSEQEVNWTILNVTMDNLMLAMGLVEGTDTGGTGTLADPWHTDRDPERIFNALEQSAKALNGRLPGFYQKGEYINTGEIFEVVYWSAKYAGGDQGMTLVKAGDPTQIPFRFMWFANSRFLRYAAT